MRRAAPDKPIDKQVSERISKEKKKKKEYAGNTEVMISTGSTLLDLAISGGRVRGGGIPGGIIVEIFGPESSGKTVLLCEIAGGIQRHGGNIMFHDPEARLNNQFAQIFDLKTDDMDYMTPNTVTEVFTALRGWEPDNDKINGIITDSLAALSTDLEMDEEEGDKMGMRRAKEFSEGFRKTARLITDSNLLMVCSNQIRENVDRGNFGQKYSAPGGKAIGFYSSLRLRTNKLGNLTRERTIKGKKHKLAFGAKIEVEVFKSSVWHPSRRVPVTIDFSYGIDDIRENLNYIKLITGSTQFTMGGTILHKDREKAIAIIEESDLSQDLRNEVIDTWEEVEEKFKVERKPKKR